MEDRIVRLPVRMKGPISDIILPSGNVKAVLVNVIFPGRCSIVIEDGEKYCVPYRAEVVAAYVFGGSPIPAGEPIDQMTVEG